MNKEITNPAAKAFLKVFLMDRKVNKEFYKRVPEDKFDFRIVDTKDRRSDSIRESVLHQVRITRLYIDAAKKGALTLDTEYADLSKNYSKEDLLKLLEENEADITELLTNDENVNRMVSSPWSPTPLAASILLWNVATHEVLHQGWNLALMDLLNIERFPELKEMWG